MRRLFATIAALGCAGLMASVSAQQPAQLMFPEIPFDSVPNLLKLPANIHLGEVAGVATNSKGNIYVYTRTGTTTATLGGSRVLVHGGSRLFQFDQNGMYQREIGVGIYGFLFAHVVRIDPEDNIWIVDEMANQIMKFDPSGKILMVLGRKPEALNIGNYEPPAPPAGPAGRAGGAGEAAAAAAVRAVRQRHRLRRASASRVTRSTVRPMWPGTPRATSSSPTATATRASRSTTRTACTSRRGAAGARASGSSTPCTRSRLTPRATSTPATAATTASRCSTTTGRSRRSSCTSARHGRSASRPARISTSTRRTRTAPATSTTAKSTRWSWTERSSASSVTAGKQMKEFGSVHEIDCRNDNQILVGELTNWRVQKLMLKPPAASATN